MVAAAETDQITSAVRPIHTRILFAAAAVTMTAVAAAGLLKLADWPAFVLALRQWRAFDPRLLAFAGAAIPPLECVLGVMWLLGFARRVVAITSVGMLVVMTAGYAYQLTTAGSVACGCFGRAAPAWFDHPTVVFARNAAMISALVAWLVVSRSSLPSSILPSRRPLHGGRATSTPAAFTLVELLITIVILAVLVSLAIPQLFAARERAMDARQLNSLRQHAAVFAMYQSDFGGAFPFLTDPRNETTTLRCEKADYEVEVRLFDVYRLWHIGLADRYYDGVMFSRAFASRDLDNLPYPTFMLYPIIFVARPEYWNLETRTRLDDQIGATFDHEALFPSKKILLGEWAEDNERRDAGKPVQPASFVDGSAIVFPLRILTARAPAELRTPRHSSSILYLPFSFPWFYTFNGIRGRDIP